ncbi:hypothetical protein [Planctomyces sp. SH-PL62]|uniref:hypothetical protein n=1 Tax=Planctomyces sp. SH-PL62 TaxID=1636152 RepID=UPI00078BCE07|nr:hypothetical protein [Planctomyces sp. SH-PL62]AMV36002.1 hypothetical protein VT85_01060 [Planctomyces sp. SH-PL62]
MVSGGENEHLTGDLKSSAGDVVAPGLAVEIDKLGGIHVAVFRLAKGAVGENEGLFLSVPGGREIELYILPGGVQYDGTVRAAVVQDSGQPAYGLGLEPSSFD